ncbi:MAG: sulfotransferase [Rhodanobacter sp.]|nr:MAG: sulfotransferase [Rhodanobacter sp.]TAL88659.1 MAG: sulfotransferase [Rhodanobacter sp.]TAM40882.1 MAG: sulfotransferase [Rhodanobacter sp.]TAN25718.1 MAG: sulfotransferase [Rhodanobacter sp.]
MKFLFVVGCPRSGTTWLQMLLAQHPAVATAQETHLFNGYLAGLQAAWDRDRDSTRGIGLQAALTEEEFNDLCANFARAVMKKIASSSPGSKLVLEKTPAHVRHVALILKLFPDARFIHLVRDPRATVASLSAAGRSWGHAWASRDPVENARTWLRDVSAGRGIAAQTEHVVTVKYEDLLESEGWQVLQHLFKWMDLEANRNFCQQAQANCAIDRLRNKSEDLESRGVVDSDPPGFYRKGAVDSWVDDLSARNLQSIEYLAGDLMREFGYAAVTKFAARTRKPRSLKRRELLSSLEWRANRAIARVFQKVRHLG